MSSPSVPQKVSKTNSFFLMEGLIAGVLFIFSVILWCLRQLFGLDTKHNKNDIAQLRIRTESEIDTLREEVVQMRAEILSLKSSVIAIRRHL
jgi:hypothetical protein